MRLAHIFERAGVKRVHLDICDGQFVPTRTIDGYSQLVRLASSLEWDVHLMVQKPEEYMDHWGKCARLPDGQECVRRFIVHVEATDVMPTLVEHAHGHGQELWAAINPDTPLEVLATPNGMSPDGVCVMGVVPGMQGRQFVSTTIDRIRELETGNEKLPIMVDGGITPETAPQCARAGAGILVSGSYIVHSLDPFRALDELRSSVS